jgi:general secretion pathway protein K
VIKNRLQKQRGVALLAALILMLAVVLILTNIFYRHQIDVSQASASLHGDQALLIAISGEGWAGELLSDKNDNRNIDDYGEIWAQAMPLLPVEGGTLKGCISDLQGKINLNSFVSYRGASLNNELNNFGTMGVAKAWLNLMDMLQIPASPDRVASIVDWVDVDSTIINSWGAEQPDYEGLTFPRMVANDFISDASELAAIKSYSVQEVQMLSPWMTALPGSTPININTASDQLILALGGENGQQFLDLIKQMRPISDINAFYQELEAYFLIPLIDVQKRWPSTLVSVKSDYFQLYLEVTLGEARIQVKSIMDRQGRTKPVIIAREVTVVPASLPDKEELSAAEQLFAKKSGDEEPNEQLMQQSNIVQPACVAMGLTGEIT